MKTFRRSILLLAMLLGGCAWSPSPPPAAWSTREQADRRILVAFADRSLTRGLPAEPTDRYRSRGEAWTSTWSRRVTAQLAEDHQLRMVSEWPIDTLSMHCVVYEVAESRSLEQVLTRLAQDQRVELAQKMRVFRVLGRPHNDPYFKLQASSQTMRLEAAHDLATGRGVTVAVIDTGMDWQHPDLRGQVIEKHDFVTGDEAAFAEDVHGTAVAGVIAALANNGQGIAGVAPDAKLMALKACWAPDHGSRDAVCDTFTLAQALNKAIHLRPRILNLSLTGPADPLLTQLVEKARAEGQIIVAAAPEASPEEPVFPASLPGVIAVRTTAAEIFPATAVAAPGSDVLTTLPHGAYDFLSGSSFAAAHVSGLIALLLELRPQLDPDTVSRLLAAARDGGLSVNACLALIRFDGAAHCPEPSAARPTD